MNESQLTGSCGCGAVRFEVSAPPVAAAYCHCTRCQKRTGTATQVSVLVSPESVRIVSGSEHLRDWSPGPSLAKTFCVLCGSHLFGRKQDTGDIRVVRMAAFDNDPGIRPMAHQFVAYAAPWEPIPDDGLPRFDEAAGRRATPPA